MNRFPPGKVLDTIVAHKIQEVAARKAQLPLADFLPQLQKITSQPLETAIRQSAGKSAFILEIKPASPSAGQLKATLDLDPLLALYTQYGAAISVLTDQTYFGGSLGLLQQVAKQVSLPTLCKDFVMDPYQVYEARKAGAQAVLLIVKALSDSQLSLLNQLILDWGMTPLIEVQDEAEVDRALAVNPSILLINNRDLQTLTMDLSTTHRLAPRIPDSVLKISASGMQTREDILRLQDYCDGFLIGSTLMREPTPLALEKKLQGLLT
ncbi:indole-3-glycerol-phosphate synthase [Vampirovibrio sp.]|uniref:indole-3-glycerol phosphate synthase TrpC n=1 Tax=Vampirovibrio sp. TaxID=2717857 RepID=UPI0035936B6D